MDLSNVFATGVKYVYCTRSFSEQFSVAGIPVFRASEFGAPFFRVDVFGVLDCPLLDF